MASESFQYETKNSDVLKVVKEESVQLNNPLLPNDWSQSQLINSPNTSYLLPAGFPNSIIDIPDTKCESTSYKAPVLPSFDLSLRLEAIDELSKQNLLASQLLQIETILADELIKLDFGDKVSHVYNPIDYAYKPHMEYYRKFCRSSAEVVMIGINPGPFGMSQTGVPFGEVKTVIEWMQICESVGSPTKLHSKRPVLGFDCRRSEVSGSRIWNFLKDNFETPENFFGQCFIYNYCPLAFMQPSGKNITPAQLPAKVREQIIYRCDEALLRSIQLFPRCRSLVGIGRFAEQRIQAVCKAGALPHQQTYLMHPSPQNPNANKNWTPIARKHFEELGLLSQSLVGSTSDAETGGVSACAAVKRKLFTAHSDI